LSPRMGAFRAKVLVFCLMERIIPWLFVSV